MACWKVIASKEVRLLGKTRRRTVKVGGALRTMEFGQEPVFLDCLPPEIEADEHLVKVEVSGKEAAAAGANFVRLRPLQTSAAEKEDEEAARQELLRRQAAQGGAALPPAEPPPAPEPPPPAPAPAKPVQLVSPKAGPNRRGGRKAKK